MQATKYQKILKLFAFFYLSVIILQIGLLEYLPFQDHYEWLLQAKIVHQLWLGDGFLQTIYKIQFFPPPPNVLFPLVLAGLQFIFSVHIAGKLCLSLFVLLFCLGFYRGVGRDNPLRFLGFLILFNLFFYQGFFAYLLGITGLFWALPLLMQENYQPRKIALHLLIWSIVLYLTHGFVYGIFLISVLVWLIKHHKKNNLQHLGIYGMALLPSFILVIFYIKNLYSPLGSPIAFYDSLFQLMQVWRYSLLSFHRLPLMESIYSLSILNLLYLFILVGLVWLLRKRVDIHSYAFFGCCVFFGLFLLNPIYRIGHFFPPNGRFLLPAIFLLVSAIRFKELKPKFALASFLFAIIFSSLHLAQFSIFSQQTMHIVNGVQAEYQNATAPLVLGKTPIDAFNKTPHHILSGLIKPYNRIEAYLSLTKIQHFSPINAVSILKMRSSPKVDERIQFMQELNTAQTLKQMVTLISRRKKYIKLNFDRIIIIGNLEKQNKIRDELLPNFESVKVGEKWLVLGQK